RHRWKELADLLETSIDVIPDNRGKALRLWSIGLIREEHLDDRSTAARDYARALRLSPNLAPAQAALARIHEDAGEMPQLFDLLATNLDHAKNPRQRATLALHLADILARRGEHMRQAAQLYERAAESPEPPLWSLWSLIRIYRLLGLRAEAGRALSRLADVTNDETFNVELHLALGTAGLHGGLGDPLPHLKEARDANVARAFAERASEFYLRTPGRDIESEAKLLPLLQDRAQKLRDPFERACAWTEIGDRQRTMDDAAGAESAYLAALEHMGGHLVAIDGLGSIFREQSRWVELAELLEREAATLESTPNIASAFFQAGELWEEKVEDTRRAAALYERALQVQNGHLEAYTRLRALHEKKNEWAELATLMRTQITATSEAQSVGEMFRDLGRVYLDHLGQPRKAEACLRRVVDLIPFDTYALLTLANLYADRGKWDAAEDAYSQAEAILVDADLRHHVHLRLAEVYQALRDPTRAFAAFQRALADTHHADVALIADAADAARAANQPREEANLLERLADATIEPDKQIAFRKTVAQIAEDRLDDDDRAIRALQQVLAIDPLDIDATEQLAAIYGRRGSRSAVHQHLQAAVSHHRAELASQRPFDPILYHHLGRIFRWQRLFDRLYCSCVILSQLDAIPDSEARFAQDHHRRCAILPAAPLAPQRFERLILPPEVQSPLRPFLRDAGPSLRKLIAEKPSHLGLSRSSRVAPKAPLYLAVTKLAEILGFEAFEVWVNAKEPEVVAPVYFSAPALILGSAVAERISASTPADRFRIAHALFLLTEGALFLQDRSVRGIQALLGALGSLAQPEMTVPLMSASADDVAAELPALTKALGRKERRQIGALLELLAPHLATIDVGAFARGLAFGATRAGLVLAGDPGEGLRQSLINLGDLDGPHSDAIADAFNYLVSEEYFTLRIELGLAPGSA
ncbi:MAG: hypothetical protein KAI47_04105, partial [Deltaproteobacteria bacterium]|nr:hypothetical protein [Deltaproteobacteria bacterium]